MPGGGQHSHSIVNGCYEEVKELTCGYPEQVDPTQHTHTDTCYKTTQNLICTIPETDPVSENSETNQPQTYTLETEVTLDSATSDKTTVKLTASEDAFGVPARELTLVATPIEDATAKDLLEQQTDAPTNESTLRKTLLFDIKVMRGEEELQPTVPVEVTFSGIDTPQDNAQVFHVDTEAEIVEEMTVDKKDNGDLTLEAPHFSIYGVTYTVDFHNGDITFSILGESEVMLSTIFENLGITKNITDVESVEFTNPELIAIEQATDDWKLTSLKSFDTEEELSITFKGGEVYKLRVTDPPFVNGVPVLNPTKSVTVINETTNAATDFDTLKDAMNHIGPGIAGTSYTVVFTQDYASTQADWNAVANNGAQAKKITVTSAYNDGTSLVMSSLTMLPGDGAAHNMSTDTEFKHITFKYGNSYPRIYARGHKLTMGEGVACPAVAAGYEMQIYGGSSTAHITNSDVTVLSGTYKYVFGGGAGYNVSGKANITIGGTASVTNAIAGSYRVTTPATAEINMTIDGSGGAKVTNVYASYKALSTSDNSAITAGATINATIRNMKDIVVVDLYSYTSATGTVTIDGDVQVQNKVWTNKNLTDVELAADATLTVGSNSDESVAGTTAAYDGYLYVGKDLILNSNSKLDFAGTGTSDGYYHMIEGNINVQGTGAEIDIFKSGITTYPLTIRGTGAYVGTQQLKLGVHKDPNAVGTQDACLSDVLLSFATANNAKTENYMAGTGVDGILKSGGNIMADKLLDDPIDVGVGWVNIGVTNPYYDASDPASAKTCTIQYVGGTDKPYARDKKVAPSYTLTGTNNDDYLTWPISRGKVTVARDTTVELILDNVAMKAAETKAFEVSYTDVTMTLKDGSTNNFEALKTIHPKSRVNEYGDTGQFASSYGGIIGKNGMSGTLTMRCEHSNEPEHRCLQNGTCGVFNGDASQGVHAPVIGSYMRRYDPNKHLNDGGFSNLYIKGGIYNLKASGHNAAIGATCFLWYGTYVKEITLLNGKKVSLFSPQNSPASRGEMCKNINISKARVISSCDSECAPAIGAGYGGMVDGITITDGAYVYAKGGDHAPGIGSGSAVDNGHAMISDYAFHVKNIKVTGGDTVVEAIGGKGLADMGVSGSVYMPGIGVGGSNQSPGYHAAGSLTNAYAEPDDGYVAVIKQGITPDRTQALYIDGSPSAARLDVKVNQPYTLIFFPKIGKTASVSEDGGVNWQPDDPGTPTAPVIVNEGNQVRYKIDLGSIVENKNAITGEVSDELPPHMTLIETPGTFTPGMTWDTNPATGITTVKWANQSFSATNKDFYFTVSVDTLPKGVVARDFVNTGKVRFVSNGSTVELPTSKTYHHVDRNLEFIKVDPSGTPLQGAGFTIFECTNTTQGHVHTDGACTWDRTKPLKPEVITGANGYVAFSGFALGKQYLLVETTTPATFIAPDARSYILIDVLADGTYTLTGKGSFVDTGMVEKDNAGYKVKNKANSKVLKVKKTILGPAAQTPFTFEVVLTDGANNPVAFEAGQPVGVVVNNNKATFSLNKDEEITLSKIPAGTKATITETNYDGYTVQINDATAGGAVLSRTNTAQVTINNDQAVEVINNPGVELPKAGATPSVLLTLGGLITLGLFPVCIGIRLKRVRERGA